MPMHREVLKQYLRAGPSRRFDVAHFSHKLPEDAPASAYLFTHGFLNNAVLFKWVDDEPTTGEESRPVNTLIYLPYDRHKPGEGGESLIFCEENLQRLCEYKVTENDSGGRAIAADLEKLRILDALPTFSPFVVELAFQRAAQFIPEAYLQLTPEVRTKLTAHLMGRLRPLIVAAYRQTSANIEKAVEDLTAKLFCLRDAGEVLPLIEALRLPAEKAQDVLSSWTGITYFEYEYATLQPKLKQFATWMAHHSHADGHLTRQDRDHIAFLAAAVRQKIRADWNDIVTISGQYRESYDAMVFQGNLEPFIRFLKTAQADYWRMGEVLGRLDMTVAVWARSIRHCGERRLPYPLLFEMLAVLRDLLLGGERPTDLGSGSRLQRGRTAAVA